MNGRHSDPWPKPPGTYDPHRCPDCHEGWWCAFGIGIGFTLAALAWLAWSLW